MSHTIKVVLTGCGGMSNAWFGPAKEFDDVEFVGLVDINEAAAISRKEEHGFDSAVTGTDLKAVIEQTNADVVFDVTIPEAHHQVTLTALNNDCHILGEKPMADSMAHAREMVAASKANDKLYAVIQNRRYTKDIIAFRDLVQAGTVGDLHTVNADFYIGAHFSTKRGKRDFRDSMEHVLLLDMAIHSFDQARFIVQKDPVSVYCHEWNPNGSWYDRDASANCIFEMSDGTVFNYRGSWCSEGLNTTWECDWRVIGTGGSAKWDGGNEMAAQCVKSSDGFFSEMDDVTIAERSDIEHAAHAGLIRDFIDAVKGGATPQTHCTDNIKSLAMVFGAIESAETGTKVSIEI